ncbi:hypothetical protein MMC07_007939 [Pseudocyphellaria aurata]|nr:hypothetical protein [Pseudocyphellaria aurata]
MCEIVIGEPKRSRQYNKTTPPPPEKFTVRIVRVPTAEETDTGERPVVKLPVIDQPAAVNLSVANLPGKLSRVKTSAVKLQAKKSSAEIMNPPPSNGGDQPTTKSGGSVHTRAKHPPASQHPLPQTGRRATVKRAPATNRMPKVVRFAFDETRNTAMELIDRPIFRGPTSSSSSDGSFTEASTLVTPPTPQFGFDQAALRPSYVEPRLTSKSVRFAPGHTSPRTMEWNAGPASDKMSRNASVKNWINAAPGPAYQTAHATTPTKVSAKHISPARVGDGVIEPREPMYLPDSDSDMWDVDSDLDSFIDHGDWTPSDNGWHWNDHYKIFKPREPAFAFQSTDKASSSLRSPKTSSSRKSRNPKTVYQSESKASPSPLPAKKPLEPVFVYRKKGESVASCMENPVFVWRPSSDVKKETRTTHGSPPAALFKYFDPFSTTVEDRPSSSQRRHHKHRQPTTDETTANASSSGRAKRDHSKKTRHDSTTHLPAIAEHGASASERRHRKQQQQLAADERNTANSGSGRKATRDYPTQKTYYYDPSSPTNYRTSRHSHSTRNRNPPSEEDTTDDTEDETEDDDDDDDDVEEVVRSPFGYTWRDI